MRFLKYFMPSEDKNSRKILVYIVLIVGALVYTFFSAIQNGMHQVIPGGVGLHRDYLTIAVSELRYELTGYRGYRKVRDALLNHGIADEARILDKYRMTKEKILQDGTILNNAIKEALNVDDVSSAGEYALVRDDLGLIPYYKLAFRIFGYKVESLFYLYFLLLGCSVFVFLGTYCRRVDLLNVLLLFVCSHFVVVSAAPVVGIELQTVHNNRFLPVLAVLPALYLALLILGRHRWTVLIFIGACVQALILMLVIFARSSAMHFMMFLSATFALACLWYWMRNPNSWKYVLNKVRLWPLMVVLLAFLALKAHLLLDLHPSYSAGLTRHWFWHAAYLGLGAHPDSQSKYGIEYDQDSITLAVVKQRARELHGTDRWESLGGVKFYERIIRDEFMKIVRQDPVFAVKNYLSKPMMFAKNYFSFYFGGIHCLLKCSMLVVVMLSALLAGKAVLKRWLQYFWLLVLGFAFALLPGMFAMPSPALIADPALLLTLMIFMLFSGAFGLFFQRYVIFYRNCFRSMFKKESYDGKIALHRGKDATGEA